MKIEIGESLVASWLKHVKCCTLVQTNWKPSPQWTAHNTDEIERLVEDGKNYFRDLNVFRNNAGASQILLQTECDVIGLVQEANEHGGIYRWHVVEVAFHENGVQYGTKHVTAAKIVGKMFRAAIGLLCYMDVREGEIYFATPKATRSYAEVIRPAFDRVVEFFRDRGFGFQFHLLMNNEFLHEILSPVNDLAEVVSDTAELFLRATQLQAVYRQMPEGVNDVDNHPIVENENNEDNRGIMGIGRLANIAMRAILEEFEDDAEVGDLLDAEYSRETFGLNYPVLVRVEEQQVYARYYVDPITICGVQYRLCREWHERSRARLQAWIDRHEQHDE